MDDRMLRLITGRRYKTKFLLAGTVKVQDFDRYSELPARLMEAFSQARRLYMEEVRADKETDHMGIKTSAPGDGAIP